MPRAADSFYQILMSRKWLFEVPFGEELLFAWSMSAMMYCHNHAPQHLSPMVDSVLSIFFSGPETTERLEYDERKLALKNEKKKETRK